MSLKEQFFTMWRDLKALGDPTPFFEDLSTRYSEQQRFYHTLNHIRAGLDELSSIQDQIRDPQTLAFAFWYHDAVYDPRAKDNEGQSAELALYVAHQIGISRPVRRWIYDLILATKHHRINKKDHDGTILLDVDMSILGKDPETFDQYERDIRREYSWIAEQEYRERRRSFLEEVLERSDIFLTSHFKDLYENQARNNIQRSLAKLS